MIEIIPFKTEHMIELMQGDLTETTIDKSDAKAKAAFYINSGISFTVVENRNTLGAGGVILFCKTVGEIWGIINKAAAQKYKIKTFKTSLDLVVRIFSDLNLNRLQAHCDVNIPYAIKFLEKLGFEREGIMRKYGEDGSDHYLYSIVR